MCIVQLCTFYLKKYVDKNGVVIMKVLVVCQYYFPEPVRINDICEELAKQGHEVDVITDFPNYPMGKIYDGYKNKKYAFEKINGVNVNRVFTVPRGQNVIGRFLNYFSFTISSTFYVKKIKKDYDVVFVNQLSPVMMAYAGIKYKRKHHKKLVLYCLDLWPESLTAGGINKNSLIFKIFHKISKKIYVSSDKILITSKSFKQYFVKEFNIADEKISYLPQYAEELFKKEKCKRKYNKNEFNFVFAGNIGKAQNIDVILNAAKELNGDSRIKFHIVGDGSFYKNVVDYKEKHNLNNLMVYGRKPLGDMPSYYKLADAMIVTLSGDSLVSTTLPGKVQTYMAAGKVIIGSANGETKEVLQEAQCGFCCNAGDYKGFINAINKFINQTEEERTILEENSYNYYQNNFIKNKFIDKLIDELKL